MTVGSFTSSLRIIWSHPANRGRRLGRLAFVCRIQLERKVWRRAVAVPLGHNGGRIWVEPNHRGGAYVLLANPPDWPHMLVWERRLRAGDLFLDVGANIGTYSILAASKGAKVIAVEPASETINFLHRNILLNGWEVDIREAAVGSQPGSASFTQGFDQQNHLDVQGSRTVAVTTIDEILGHRRAAGLKLDVEGYELEALRGARKALRGNRIDLLQLEWNSLADRTPVADLLAEFGYGLFAPRPGGDLVPWQGGPADADVFALAPRCMGTPL